MKSVKLVLCLIAPLFACMSCSSLLLPSAKTYPLSVFKDQPSSPPKNCTQTTWDKTAFGSEGPMLKADTKRGVAVMEDVPLKMSVYQYWAPDGYWVWAAADGERVILAKRSITLPPQAGTIYKSGYYPTPQPIMPRG